MVHSNHSLILPVHLTSAILQNCTIGSIRPENAGRTGKFPNFPCLIQKKEEL